MISEKPIIVECPNCKKCALPIWRPETVCANCGKKYKWHELQRKWQRTFISTKNGSKNSSDEIFESCVRCIDRSMIFYKRLGIWVCFSCGNGWNSDEILKCEGCHMYTDDAIESLCSACWDDGLGVSLVTPDSGELVQIQR